MTNEAWLVFGLGNPGPKYEATRHNIGQLVVAELASRIGTSLTRTKLRSNVGTGRLPTGSIPGLPGPRVVLGTSTGYMNESGGPVRQLADFYGVATERSIAVHDDVELPFDVVQAKVGCGGAGDEGLAAGTRRCGAASGEAGHRRLRAAAVLQGREGHAADVHLRPRRCRRAAHQRRSRSRAAEVPFTLSGIAAVPPRGALTAAARPRSGREGLTSVVPRSAVCGGGATRRRCLRRSRRDAPARRCHWSEAACRRPWKRRT